MQPSTRARMRALVVRRTRRTGLTRPDVRIGFAGKDAVSEVCKRTYPFGAQAS